MDTEGAGVVAFDWPAHGESNASDDELTVERCLADLEAVVRFIKLITGQYICCFATSFGGYLATLYRNAHEHDFLYLILRSPALKMAEVYRRFLSDDEYHALMRGEIIEQGFERKMHLGKAFYESLLRNDAYNEEPPMPWNIKIIQGDKDEIVNPRDITAYADRYKDTKLKLEVFKGTDHRYKRPGEKERVVECVAEFLDRLLHQEKYDRLEAEAKKEKRSVYRDKIRGCLFGGAAGDALGYPVEFLKEDAIFGKYGDLGITRYEKDKRSGKALISDDTQMTLFTANGLLAGDTRGCLRGIQGPSAAYVYKAYFDWLITQEVPYFDKRAKDERSECWLLDVPGIFAVRVPGNTCISALEELKYHGRQGYPDTALKRNNSKGNGGLMRISPLALAYAGSESLDSLDEEGGEIARITHCHPLGYMPAAFLTHVINRIVYPHKNMELEQIITEAKDTVKRIYFGDDGLSRLISVVDLSMKLAKNKDDDLNNIHKIGEGWVAEETLGIALYCALRYRDNFSAGIIAAVNHNGDSDTTGAVAGNILGALCGYEAIEEKWKEDLELSDIILEMADDLCYGCLMEEYSSYTDPVWTAKYIHKRWFADPDEYDAYKDG
ncbi:MAG: ADP-ribosylglycohydrolase family protein [Lachnospiraceae bacterium]|nr:ADP-ribosylglycohydrolase family protein [Lachnospiraceae bacterium]